MASLVANNTSSLCNTARNASQRTSNPVAKQQFIKSAKDVANGTAGLVYCYARYESGEGVSGRRGWGEGVSGRRRGGEGVSCRRRVGEGVSGRRRGGEGVSADRDGVKV